MSWIRATSLLGVPATLAETRQTFPKCGMACQEIYDGVRQAPCHRLERQSQGIESLSLWQTTSPTRSRRSRSPCSAKASPCYDPARFPVARALGCFLSRPADPDD